ncbi:MAG: hypothetical protein M5U19_03590 [Microthrixaceae bacterium]|nr:hypothetical protein [Microthrixaceae bacterium]
MIGAVVEEGFYALAVIAMLSAVIAAFLYLRVIVAMYFAGPQGAGEDSEEQADFAGPAVRIPAAAGIALALALVGTVALGVVPGPATDVARDATAELTAATPAD